MKGGKGEYGAGELVTEEEAARYLSVTTARVWEFAQQDMLRIELIDSPNRVAIM